MKGLTLQIEGMSCGHCLNAVNRALAEHPGVEIGSVQMGRAVVRFDPARTDPTGIIAAIREAGYDAAASEAQRTIA